MIPVYNRNLVIRSIIPQTPVSRGNTARGTAEYSAYLSRWDMTVFETSAPASCRMRMIWNGASLFLPGWMITGQPSCDWACAAAWSTRRSLGVKGQEQPISPTTPHLMSVPSAPLTISSTIMPVS